MTTVNPFDLLGDDDSGDLSLLIATATQKAAAAAAEKESSAPVATKGSAKLPSKSLPPAQAVREAKTETGRHGGRGGGGDRGGRGSGGDRGGRGGGGDRGYGDRGYGGSGGYNRDQPKENPFRNSGSSGGQGGNEEGDGGKSFERRGAYNGPPRNSYRPRHGENENGEVGNNEERPRRHYERRSGTGRGYEVKREGAGRGNWGTANDEITQETLEVVNETEKIIDAEKPSGEEEATDVNKEETPAVEAEVKQPEPEPEPEEMTLQEYEKVLEEKRKALQSLKTTEERKVDGKAFASMQALANKRDNDEVFAKLGSDKRKEQAEKEEKAKKTPVSISEFLKPAEGEKYYGGGGRRGGRGGARGGRGPREGGYGGGARTSYHVNAPKIEDPSQFPVLGAK